MENKTTTTNENVSRMLKPVSTNTKTLVATLWFVIVFAMTLLVLSIYDYELSLYLTKGTLAPGEYFSTSQFGLFFEAMGSAPIWIFGAIAATIFFWNFVRLDNKALRVIFGIIFAAVSVVVLYMFFSDLFKYVLEKVNAKAYGDEIYVIALKLMLAASIGAMLILLWKNVKPETTKILLKWAIVIVCVAAFYLLITVLKGPIGRMRFRTMNYLGYNDYTDWFEINGAREIGGLPSDACKSFPSGHTFSAGVIYTIICLPHLLPSWNKKWVKAVVWIASIAFTGTVAVSRIVVGAHFATDVLFGGTIAFLATILFREIIVDNCKHFKALGQLFKGRKKNLPAENGEEIEE